MPTQSVGSDTQQACLWIYTWRVVAGLGSRASVSGRAEGVEVPMTELSDIVIWQRGYDERMETK
jgi:hypothetical protein